MIERRVNRYSLGLYVYPDGSQEPSRVNTHTAIAEIQNLVRSTPTAVAGSPQHLHQILPDGSRRYLIHVLSNQLDYAFARICRTNLTEFPYTEQDGNLTPLSLDPNAGISYESYFLVHHPTGDVVMEYTSRGPKFGDLKSYLEDKLSGHAIVPVDQVELAAVHDQALLDRFINEMGAITELQLVVKREDVEAVSHSIRRLGDSTDPELLAISEQMELTKRTVVEAEQIGVLLGRRKFAKTGGLSTIKRPLVDLIREHSGLFTSVQGRIEGSRDDGGRTEPFNLLSERTARSISVQPHPLNPRYVDPADMGPKLRDIYLRMLGSEGGGDGTAN